MALLVNNTKRIDVFFNCGSKEHATSWFKPICSVQGWDKSNSSRTNNAFSPQAGQDLSLCQAVQNKREKIERDKSAQKYEK